jgi:hypothetical protein
LAEGHDSPKVVQSIDTLVSSDVKSTTSTQDSANGTLIGSTIALHDSGTPKDVESLPLDPANEMDEGILETSWFYCNCCGTEFKN